MRFVECFSGRVANLAVRLNQDASSVRLAMMALHHSSVSFRCCSLCLVAAKNCFTNSILDKVVTVIPDFSNIGFNLRLASHSSLSTRPFVSRPSTWK
jgi:hypothetical protein